MTSSNRRFQNWSLFLLIVPQATLTTRTLSAFPGDRFSSVLVNSNAKIFRLSLRCHPQDSVPPGGSPPLVTQLSTWLARLDNAVDDIWDRLPCNANATLLPANCTADFSDSVSGLGLASAPYYSDNNDMTSSPLTATLSWQECKLWAEMSGWTSGGMAGRIPTQDYKSTSNGYDFWLTHRQTAFDRLYY